MISQRLHDQRESKRGVSVEGRREFQEIKANLDARRLLADLSHSHGVIPDKYEVTKGKDGSDRIKAGNRHLNVSDFLTKELRLSWHDTAKILRDSYERQRSRAPAPGIRREPSRQLWGEFQSHRRTIGKQYAKRWDEQRTHERERWDVIKKDFYAIRIQAQRMNSAECKAAVSVARMERLAKEALLRECVKREREQLKSLQRKPSREQYRDFLAEMAQAGDEQALFELRRMRTDLTENDRATAATVKPTERQRGQDFAPLYRATALAYVVAKNGDVTYQREGCDVLRDAGRSVHMLQQDPQTIETGLRLAVQKFGSRLTLSGPQDFQERAARIAVEAGLKVEFSDQHLNTIMQERRAQLDAERAREAEARKLAQDFAEQLEQERSSPVAPNNVQEPAAERPTPKKTEQIRRRTGPGFG